MERLMNEVRSASDLLKTIIGNVQDIIRSEVSLAKAEVKEETRKAAGAMVFMASAGVLGLLGLFYVLFSIMLLLNRLMPGWAAALSVALLVFAIGGVLFSIGRSKFRKFSAAPQKTIGSVKENVEWFRNQTV
jgi:uncharacterized membrane protein YqjE